MDNNAHIARDSTRWTTGNVRPHSKGTARVFAGHGAKTLIVARNLKDAEAAAQELSNGGATVLKGTFLAIKACIPHLKMIH